MRTLGDPASNQLDFAHASQQLSQNGRALSQQMFDVWHSLSPLAPQMRAHDTNVGLMMGERHYSTATTLQAVQPPPGPTGPTIDVGLTFLLPLIANRTPMFDDRRLPDLTTITVDPEHAHLEAQDRFVRTLRPPDGPAGFGATWAQGGDSFGLVTYVANCDHFGGLHQNGYVGMSVGGSVLVQQVPSLIDGLFDVFPVPRPLSPEWKAAGIERPAGSIVNVLTHEVGHTEAIGHLDDEYGSDIPRQSPDAQAIEHIATYPNTQVLANALDGSAISATKLKWNWHRLEAAGEIESIVAQGQQIAITLNIENWQRWPAHTIGRTAFLRVRSATLVEGVPLSEPLVIREVRDADQTIVLDVPLGNVPDALVTVFSAHGIIVLPRVDANNEPLRLVDPNVIAALAHGPFEATTNCVPAAQKGPPATIANYSFPPDHNTVIAAYETAGQFDCGVIRPTAECKMRQAGDMSTGKPVDYCFVCRYIIVDAIDPASHGELDQQTYPRAPRR